MYLIKEYLKKIIDNNKVDEMHEIEKLFCDMITYLKENNIEMYHDIKRELYTIANGKVITLELAEKWVSEMRPMAKWTKAETDSILKQKGLQINDIDFYVAMNMIYSDFHNAIDDDTEKCILLAVDFLKDEDVSENKLYNYYYHIVK